MSSIQSNTCYCGNSYGRYGLASSDSSCNLACNGNPNQICGAAWLNSVYTMPSWATGMINHWAFTNNYLDSVTLQTPTTAGSGLTFVSDRSSKTTSALSFTGGYLILPSATYFNGDLTITVWGLMNSFNTWSRVIDCAATLLPAQNSDNVLLAATGGTTGSPVLSLTNYNGGGDVYTWTTTQLWTIGVWGHVAVTLSGTTSTLYFNNVQKVQSTQIVPRGNARPYSYIGYSRYVADGLLNGYLDDLRVFSRALSTTELTQVYNYNK